MTRTPYRLSDLGETFPWTDLRDFISHVPPVPECALYRAQYPKSWWWTADMDFLSAILVTGQWANWQRGGGKGDKPKPIKRPKDVVMSRKQPKTRQELQERKTKVQQEIRRRRELSRGN
jgi:hypothetical protein